MLLKSCPRCKKFMPYGKEYCESCMPIVLEEREARLEAKRKKSKQEYNKRYNAKRDPKYTRFYNGSDWKRLSQWYVVHKGYRCELCGKIATEVHHIEPIQSDDGWDKRLDIDNLELLCKDCHNKRHKRFGYK